MRSSSRRPSGFFRTPISDGSAPSVAKVSISGSISGSARSSCDAAIAASSSVDRHSIFFGSVLYWPMIQSTCSPSSVARLPRHNPGPGCTPVTSTSSMTVSDASLTGTGAPVLAPSTASAAHASASHPAPRAAARPTHIARRYRA
jgi:hypothetical protein